QFPSPAERPPQAFSVSGLVVSKLLERTLSLPDVRRAPRSSFRSLSRQQRLGDRRSPTHQTRLAAHPRRRTSLRRPDRRTIPATRASGPVQSLPRASVRVPVLGSSRASSALRVVLRTSPPSS